MNTISYILLLFVVSAFILAARYRAKGGGGSDCCGGGERNAPSGKCGDGEVKGGHKKSVGKDGAVRCTGSCCELGIFAERRRLKSKEEYERDDEADD